LRYRDSLQASTPCADALPENGNQSWTARRAITYGDRRAVVKNERRGFGRLRIASIDVEQGAWSRKIRVNSLDPSMIETKGLRASGMERGAFREQQEKKPRLAASLQWGAPLLKVSNGIKLGV